MLLDKVTETIAYFIGLFQLVTEAARGRLDYDGFKAEQKATELDPLFAPSTNRDVSFDPEGHHPQVNNPHTAIHQAATATATAAKVALPQLKGEMPPPPAQPGSDTTVLAGVANIAGPMMLTVQPPGGSIHLTWQENHLSDRDVLRVDLGLSAAWGQLQAEVMLDLKADAQTLQILDMTDGSAFAEMASAQIAGLAEDLVTGAATASATLPGASIHLAVGSETQRITINGVEAEELPDWTALLPVVPQEGDDSDVSAGVSGTNGASQGTAQPGNAVEGSDVVGVPASVVGVPASDVDPEDTGGDVPPSETSDTSAPHMVITGGNVAINAISNITGGVDAPVIAVAGDVVSFDVISQINVLLDDNFQNQTGNLLQNSAAFSGMPALADAESDTEETGTGETTSDGPSSGGGAAPGLVAVSTLNGDLVNFSWTKQINSTIDGDAVQISTSATGSWVDLGGNMLLNVNNLFSQAMGFDLILVGGNMISQHIVQQTNIVLDWDSFMDGAGNDLLSGGQSEGLFSTGSATPDSDADTGGNTLINSASITHTALDTFAGMTAEFQSVLESFINGSPDVSPLFGSGAMQSQPVLNVLYIAGDLIDVHLLSQINILSDSDLIAGTAPADGTEIHTGLNAAVNDAHLIDVGMESDVFAGGNIYSDAVLYQANLISEDVPPTDVLLAPGSIDGLASEAVAFLSDGMTSATPVNAETNTATGDTSVAQDGPIHTDIMQTMLA